MTIDLTPDDGDRYYDAWPIWRADADAREDAAAYYRDLDTYERMQAADDPAPRDQPDQKDPRQ